MKPIEKLNNYDEIYINLFGKRKKVNVFSCGEEIACLNWFIENVNIEDYRQEIADYCNDEYDAVGRKKRVTAETVEKEIKIYSIAVNISKITQSKDGFVYPEISFYGDCKCDPEHGICIGFRDKKFLGIEEQGWTL